MKRAAESLYKGLNAARRALYRRRILKSKRLPKPVISVGNISAGGAGKTPCVIAIARRLVAEGLRVCVLTRGYGRRGKGGIVTKLDAEQFGDEPVLISRHVPDAIVAVGSKRYEIGKTVDCDVYLLDDGFQHLQLHRDLDVVINVRDARFYREGRSALADAHLVIPRRTRPENVAGLHGKKAFAFAGIANNQQFFAMLRDHGVSLTGTRGYPDHHRYTPADLADIRSAANGADLILTTEKDAVKIGDHDIIAVAIEFIIEDEVMNEIVAVARR